MRWSRWGWIAVAALGCDDAVEAVVDATVLARDARPAVVDAARPPVDQAVDAAAMEDAALVADAAPIPDSAPPVDAAPAPDLAVVDLGAPDAEPPDAAVPPEAPLRVVVLGDVGKANDGQRRVAAAIEAVCIDQGGCDFALLTGDNIYESGVDGVDDPQWIDKFEAPYANLDFPFYATLGNHDYGAPPILQDFAAGIGIDPTRGQAQLDYAASQDKFRMPSSFYRFHEGPAEFVGLNTASMFWRDLPFIEALTGFAEINLAQEETLPQWAAAPLAPWRIAFGHHPYLSNGRHGNAGQYDFVFLEGLIGSGTGVQRFFERHVLGQFDVYLCGHDHNLQDLGEVEGTTLVVSGAGASTTDLRDPLLSNEVVYQTQDLGFVLLEITPAALTLQVVAVPEGADAARGWVIEHSRTLRR